METLSVSRIQTFLACARRHYLRYELHLIPTIAAQPLRFGSAFHRALAARANGQDYESALEVGLGEGGECDALDAAILAGLLAGYYKRWADDQIQMSPEIEIHVPMRYSRFFEGICVLDGLGTWNGRQCLFEHKTTSSAIDDASDYWTDLRFDLQLSFYLDAITHTDWKIETVLYDVVRKPSIKQKQTETLDQYGERLMCDVQERPEFYYNRKEISVLSDEIDECCAVRDCVARQILQARREQARYKFPEFVWPRCKGRFSCMGCEFKNFCTQGIHVDKTNPPSGFQIKANTSGEGWKPAAERTA